MLSLYLPLVLSVEYPHDAEVPSHKPLSFCWPGKWIIGKMEELVGIKAGKQQISFLQIPWDKGESPAGFS